MSTPYAPWSWNNLKKKPLRSKTLISFNDFKSFIKNGGESLFLLRGHFPWIAAMDVKKLRSKMVQMCVAGSLLLRQCLVFLKVFTISTPLMYDHQSQFVPPAECQRSRCFWSWWSEYFAPAPGGDSTSLVPGLGPTFVVEVSLAHRIFPPFAVPQHFLDPIDTCLVPVTGLSEGLRPFRLCPFQRSQCVVNHRLLRALTRSPIHWTTTSAWWTLANKTFILRDFFSSHGLDSLCLTGTCIGAGECSTLVELLPAYFSYVNSSQTSDCGGGTATVYKNDFKCKQRTVSSPFSCFEVTLFEVGHSNPMLCAVIYQYP